MKTNCFFRISFLAVLFFGVSTAVAARWLLRCGNHDPAHTAVSAGEARSLSEKNGCKAWDVFDPNGELSKVDRAKIVDALKDFGIAPTELASIPGTWSWSLSGRQGSESTKFTLKLKAEEGKLTGVILSPSRQGTEPMPVEISDGKIKGDEISFKVKRELNGNTLVTEYTGRVEGDRIKGKMEVRRRDGGEPLSRDWEAKREK